MLFYAQKQKLIPQKLIVESFSLHFKSSQTSLIKSIVILLSSERRIKCIQLTFKTWTVTILKQQISILRSKHCRRIYYYTYIMFIPLLNKLQQITLTHCKYLIERNAYPLMITRGCGKSTKNSVDIQTNLQFMIYYIYGITIEEIKYFL